MEALAFTTDLIAPRERATAWCRSVSTFFEGLRVADLSGAPLQARVQVAALGEGRVVMIDSTPQRVVRVPPPRPDTTSTAFNVLLQASGTGAVSQGGRSCLLEPGAFALIDGSQPFELSFTGSFQQVLLQVPRALVAGRYSLAAVRTAQASDPAAGADRFLSETMLSLARSAADMDEVGRAAALGVLTQALGLASVLRADGQEVARRRFERALADIDTHLADPLLTPNRLAEMQGVSRRYLDGLFAALGTTPAAEIRERRLQRCAEALRSEAWRQQQVLEIALAHGFSDAAHFSRAFHRRFGMSPSTWRRAPSNSLPMAR